MIAISSSALKMLERANFEPLTVFFEAGRETASELVAQQFLIQVGVNQYRITQAGCDYLAHSPEPASPLTPALPKIKRSRKLATPSLPTYDQLSEIQRSILHFIDAYRTSNGYSPRYLEIKAALGVSSMKPLRYDIGRLKKAGFLECKAGMKRELKLIRSLPPEEIINSG